MWEALLEGYIVLIVIAGAVIANAIPFEYRNLRWTETEIGRVQMSKARAIRALFNLSLLVALTVALIGRQWWLGIAQAFVFTYVGVALWRQWRVLRRYRKRGLAERRESPF